MPLICQFRVAILDLLFSLAIVLTYLFIPSQNQIIQPHLFVQSAFAVGIPE